MAFKSVVLKEYAEILMNPRNEHIKILTHKIKGVPYIDIRKYYMGDDGNLKPSPNGINIKEELFDEVFDALQKAREEFHELTREKGLEESFVPENED